MRFVIHHSSQKRLTHYVYDVAARSRELRDNLETSLKRIGRYAVIRDFGPQLPARAARHALEEHGLCRDTARSHVALLVEAGELTPRGDADVVLRAFQGDIGGSGVRALPRDAIFWSRRREAKLARRRAYDAARRPTKPARSRRRSADQIGRGRAKSQAITAVSGARRCPLNNGAAPPSPALPADAEALSFSCGRLRPQTALPRSTTAIPVPEPVPAAPAPSVDAPLVVAFAPGEAPVEEPATATQPAANLSAPPPDAPSAPAASAPAMAQPKAATSGPLSPSALETPEEIRAILLRRFGAAALAEPPAPAAAAAPSDGAAPSRPKRVAPLPVRTYARPLTALEREVERLAVLRGMEEGVLNLRAVTRTGAPLPVIIEALGIVADAGKRARNPPAFFLGTVRKLLLQSRRT